MLNVPETFKQKYLDLLLKHHEVISDNKYNLGKCSTAMHDIELKNETPIYVKQFKIQEHQQEAVLMTCGRIVGTRSGQAIQQEYQQSNVCGCQEGRSHPDCARFLGNQPTTWWTSTQ
jgi:hypothetical protein